MPLERLEARRQIGRQRVGAARRRELDAVLGGAIEASDSSSSQFARIA